MNRQEIIRANEWAARQSWNDSGWNRGADHEVLEDVGIVSPERLPAVIAQVLDAHGVAELETPTEAEEAVEAAPSASRPTTNGKRGAVDVSQLSPDEKRRRDDERQRKPAPYGTADPVVLNQPGAIGLPDQAVEASTQVAVEAGFAKLHALTHPSHEVSSESAESFFEALHGHSPHQSQS